MRVCPVEDCNNEVGGTAERDECGTCVGGNTGKTAIIWYYDNDEDTWGGETIKLCADSPGEKWIDRGGDVNDNCPDRLNKADQCKASCKPTLSLSCIRGTLGDEVVLTAGGGDASAQYKFLAFFRGKWEELQQFSTMKTFNWKVNVLGPVKFKVEMQCETASATSPEVTFTSYWCVTDFTFRFGSNLNSAWNAMLSDTESTDKSDPRIYEHGFVSMWNSDSFSTSERQASAPCSTNKVTISLDYFISSSGTVEFGADYKVGDGHVHFSLKYCNTGNYILPEPSLEDKLQPARKYPRVVRTAKMRLDCGDDPGNFTTDHTFGAMTSCNEEDYRFIGL